MIFSTRILIPYTETHMANNKIFRTSKIHFILYHTNSTSRSSLSGYCEILCFTTYLRLQFYFTGNGKNNRSSLIL